MLHLSFRKPLVSTTFSCCGPRTTIFDSYVPVSSSYMVGYYLRYLKSLIVHLSVFHKSSLKVLISIHHSSSQSTIQILSTDLYKQLQQIETATTHHGRTKPPPISSLQTHPRSPTEVFRDLSLGSSNTTSNHRLPHRRPGLCLYLILHLPQLPASLPSHHPFRVSPHRLASCRLLPLRLRKAQWNDPRRELCFARYK